MSMTITDPPSGHSVAHGGSVTVKGTGAATNEVTVTLVMSNAAEEPTGDGDSSGNFQVDVTIPMSSQPGNYLIKVTSASSRVVTRAITVT